MAAIPAPPGPPSRLFPPDFPLDSRVRGAGYSTSTRGRGRTALMRLAGAVALAPTRVGAWAAAGPPRSSKKRIPITSYNLTLKEQAGAVVVLPDPMLAAENPRIVALAAKSRLPAVGETRAFAEGDGLMAYGPRVTENFRRAAVYVDKILKGAKPGDLPVEQLTKSDLVINLKTAKALGLTIPQSLLLRADEVIQ